MKGEKEIITEDDDFVMIERNGQILSGGFHVNSILLKNKQSPMYTLNTKIIGGSNEVSDIFKDLAIPAGIFFQPKKGGSSYREEKNNIMEEQEINDDLYDKLVKLATITNNTEHKSENKMKKTKKKNKKLSSSVSMVVSKKTTAKNLPKKK